MKPQSIDILERHKEHWFTLSKAGYIKNLEYPVKKEIESVIQAELDPHYHENLWCGECVANMVRRIYTHYEKWQAEKQPCVIEEFNLPPKEASEPVAAPEPKKRGRKSK